jgi:hypothetical protein
MWAMMTSIGGPMSEPVRAEVKLNLNPNLLAEAHAITDAHREKVESVLNSLRCPEHDEPPHAKIVDGRQTIETCCDAFKQSINRALED